MVSGLAASCETLLFSELSVVNVKPIILNADNGLVYNNTLYVIANEQIANANIHRNGSGHDQASTNNSSSSNGTSRINNNTINGNTDKSKASNRQQAIIYKFFVPHFVDVAGLHFNILRACDHCEAISIQIQANALPTPNSSVHNAIINANKTGESIVNFYPQQNVWHYIEIGYSNRNIGGPLPSAFASLSTKSPQKSKAKIEKKFQLLTNDSYVDFSIGLRFTMEKITTTTDSISKNGSNENKSTENANSNITNSNNTNIDGIGSVNTSTSDSSSSSTASYSSIRPATEINDFDERTIDDELDEFGFETGTNAAKLSVKPRNINYYALLRETYREFFMFDYDLLPDDNGTVPTFINLTAGTPTGFRFSVGNVYDVGGTLSFAVVMKDNLRDVSIAAAASASASAQHGKVRDRVSSDMAVAEKLVHINDNAQNLDITTTKNSNAGNGIDSINYELNHSMDNNDVDGIDNSIARSNQTIIICMRLGEPGIPTWPDKCIYGQHTFPAASIVNNTNDETSTGLIHVAFPEPGLWYVTLGLFCHGPATAASVTVIDSVKEFIKKYVNILKDSRVPCACANRTAHYQKCIRNVDCLNDMSESETLKVKECLMDSKCTHRHKEMARKFEVHHRYATEQSVATDSSCNASAVFTISSSPCVAGRCSKNGRCYHYMSGGFVFSTCLCMKGYRGWDCTEDSQVPSSFSILLALLLLTLSNLLFIPSIYMAVQRKYFTEGIIYFFAMFFSIFYHACDSGEDEYSFCLVKIGVLQFCDFYCGLMAIWVTLIAMAHIRQTFVSMLHMFGAIVLAFGTELNKQSLWVFLAPALTGLCLISISWGWRCKRTQKWFPARKYLSIFLPIGMVLVMFGLICYAFLQTRHNYFVVHSVWHMVMALSILCLLPSRNSFIPKC